jgi:hypothetical protein
MAYEMRGQFLEACDCRVPCPCWFVQDPDEDECTGAVGWQIEQGQIEGIDVSGLNVANVSFHTGPRGAPGAHPKMRIGVFVDQDATIPQFQVLSLAFTGALGGPLEELAQMAVVNPHVDRAAIVFTSDGARTTLSVDNAIAADLTPIVGSTRRITTIADSALATLLGTPGEVGRSSRFAIDLPDQDLRVAVEGRSATRGRFAYVSR